MGKEAPKVRNSLWMWKSTSRSSNKSRLLRSKKFCIEETVPPIVEVSHGDQHCPFPMHFVSARYIVLDNEDKFPFLMEGTFLFSWKVPLAK